MRRVEEIGASDSINEINSTLNFYITEVSPPKKNREVTIKASSFAETTNRKSKAKSSKEVKGWVEEIE